MFGLNVSPTSVKKSLLKLIPYALLLLLLACPEPEPEKPQKANCPNGQLPCEEDSTVCCDVICPPGTLLGGEDSTECIPVECPEYYYLCGEDSTDCCLETTSHDIIWEIDTIFTGFVNYANDIAIINDTTIWVVGEFELDDPEDTLTNFDGRFNLIRWNGTEWIPDRIMEPEWTSIARAEAIFALSEDEVWVGNYGSPMYWNGNVWQLKATDYGWESVGGYINAIWGSGLDDVFFISNNGQINHWDGSGFNRMDTPTYVHLTNIHGTGPNDVWAVGYDLSFARSTLIHYNGEEWSLIYESGGNSEGIGVTLLGNLKNVQTFPYHEREAWVLGNNYGIYHIELDPPQANLIEIQYNGKPYSKLRGNHPNDLYVAAHHSGLYHYNGIDINEYPISGDLYTLGLDVKGDLRCMIGFEGEKLISVINEK